MHTTPKPGTCPKCSLSIRKLTKTRYLPRVNQPISCEQSGRERDESAKKCEQINRKNEMNVNSAGRCHARPLASMLRVPGQIAHPRFRGCNRQIRTVSKPAHATVRFARVESSRCTKPANMAVMRQPPAHGKPIVK